MKGTTIRRRVKGMLALLLALGVVVGLAGPAAAVYSSEPASFGWTAPAPVHATLVSGSRLYVGYFDKDTSTGGIVALDAATGILLWAVPTNGDVRALALSTSGSMLLVGGGFTTVAGNAHKHLAALSPSSGSVTAWKASTSGMVRDLVVRGDTVYVGGAFHNINGTVERGLGAVSVSTGKTVSSFDGFVDDRVYGLALTSTRLIVSGRFTEANNQPRSSLAAFDLATGDLTSWAPDRICSTCASYWDVATDASNAYVASSGPGGQLAAFDLSTGRQPWRRVHTDGDVQAVAVGGDGLVYFGGHFGRYAGSTSTPRSLLAAVKATTGAIDPGFAPKLYRSWPGVWALSATSSRLYAGGHFAGVRLSGRNDRVPFLANFPG